MVVHFRKFSRARGLRGTLLALGAMLAVSAQADATAPSASDIEAGRRIYQEGILPSGEPLKGQRADSGEVSGDQAACAKCHRRSGMGSLEGQIAIPPVSAPFLYLDEQPKALVNPRSPRSLTQNHKPYTRQSLGEALRTGKNSEGADMHAMMPRYELSEADLKVLDAYLRQLSVDLSPGVGQDSIKFAAVITPGVDPKLSEAVRRMLAVSVMQRNSYQKNVPGRMRMGAALIPRQERNWELKIWELQGAPDSWGQQLAEFYRKEPVFALVSGLSASGWEPVHAYCQKESIPCLLPSLLTPPPQEEFYPLYYSRGVALEAEVLAKHLREAGKQAPKRLVQVFIGGEAEKAAAQVLTHALEGSGITVVERPLNGSDPKALSTALKDVGSRDAVMFWLRPAELAVLKKAAPKLAGTAYLSGQLAEEQFDSIPPAWKARARLVYPYELGENRTKNLLRLSGWLKAIKVPAVNEPVQAEVLFSMIFLTDITSMMLDNYYRDYMVERAEDMLSWNPNSTAYPHLSMAPGRRFASKGAYIARFEKDGKLVGDGGWIVP